MTPSKQLAILMALTVQLETIMVANGYQFNLMGRVRRGKAIFGADEVVPFLTIIENLRPDPMPLDAGEEKLRRVQKWELLIQGWCKSDPVNPTDNLYMLKADVEKCLAQIVVKGNGNPIYPGAFRLGNNLIASLRIGPGVVRAQMPDGGTECFYLPLGVEYVMNVADPYAL